MGGEMREQWMFLGVAFVISVVFIALTMFMCAAGVC